MNNLSLRLPEDVQRRLDAEAKATHRKRSEVAREAIADYLHRQERDRFIAEVVSAARALANDPEAMAKTRRIQEEFDAIEGETLPDENFDWLQSEDKA
ncbi:MAG: ribbon-helix-helix protein, CopG family [Gammaproteobacteria bacterium]